MKNIKYTKFGKNLKIYDDNNIWNYVALDPVANACIEISVEQSYNKTDLPVHINSTSATMFDATSWSNKLAHEEITEKEFWAAYKMYLARLVQHFKSHSENGKTQETS